MNGYTCISAGEVKRFTLTAIHKKENSSSLQQIITSRPRITLTKADNICSCIPSRGEKVDLMLVANDPTSSALKSLHESRSLT